MWGMADSATIAIVTASNGAIVALWQITRQKRRKFLKLLCEKSGFVYGKCRRTARRIWSG